MEQIIPQPPELVKFLTSIEITDSIMSTNMVDDELDFVSFFYTPNLQISRLAQKNLEFLREGSVELTAHDLTEKSLIKRLKKSSLKRQNSKMYRLLQFIILEVYTAVNTIMENRQNIKDMKMEDLERVSNNIAYVCDYLGDSDEYSSIIKDLRNISLDVDYIKLQLPLIKKEEGIE